MRRIKNSDKLTKEDLIITLLKSESNALEDNFKRHFNNNNNNNKNTDDNDTYDDKIRGKISGIRMVLSRLENIVDINDRNKIKKELYEIDKRKTFQIRKKKSFMIILSN